MVIITISNADRSLIDLFCIQKDFEYCVTLPTNNVDKADLVGVS